jgi:hypothetical protein
MKLVVGIATDTAVVRTPRDDELPDVVAMEKPPPPPPIECTCALLV